MIEYPKKIEYKFSDFMDYWENSEIIGEKDMFLGLFELKKLTPILLEDINKLYQNSIEGDYF